MNRRHPSGLTRSDWVITLTLLSVTGMTLLSLFPGLGLGHMPLKIRALLVAEGKKASERLQTRLVLAREVWGRNDAGAAFLPLLEMAAPPQGRLPRPLKDEGAVPQKGAASPDVGNSLFFLVREPPAPLTGLLDGSGAPVDLQVDVFTFNFVGLIPRPGGAIAGTVARDLSEWRSVPYADYGRIAGMTDITLRNSALAALASRGCEHAFDLAASTGSAFYGLSATAPWIRPLPGHRILQGEARPLTGPKTTSTLAHFVSSVSPNTGADFKHGHPVPAFAAAEGDFPGGFETVVTGPPQSRRVAVRLVLAVQGDFRGYGSHEEMFSVTAAGGEKP